MTLILAKLPFLAFVELSLSGLEHSSCRQCAVALMFVHFIYTDSSRLSQTASHCCKDATAISHLRVAAMLRSSAKCTQSALGVQLMRDL